MNFKNSNLVISFYSFPMPNSSQNEDIDLKRITLKYSFLDVLSMSFRLC